MKVHWTESALGDVQSIEASIARHSVQYSLAMVEKIFTRGEQLEVHPLLGPAVIEFDDMSVREVFEDPYRIVYRVGDDQIDILAVIHAARRLPRGL